MATTLKTRGRPRLPGEIRKPRLISFSVTERDWNKVNADARRAGLTLQDHMRRIAVK